MKLQILAAAAALALIAAPALAHEPAPVVSGALTVSAPKARMTIPSRPASAYFTIENAGAADRLVGASSPDFGRVELHTHQHENGVMKMMKVEAIEVPANGAASLAPGGDHVMLFDPKKPLKEGDHIPLTLTFEKGGDVDIIAPVQPIKAAAEGGMDHGMSHGGMNHDSMNHDSMGHDGMKHDAMKPE